MISNQKSRNEFVSRHYHQIWGSPGRDVGFIGGPLHEMPEGFKILEFEPRSDRPMWTYATCGMSASEDISPIELHLFSPYQSGEPAELLVSVAHYHRTGRSLTVSHTVNFGKSWIGGSHCEYGLISLPYLDGQKMENLNFSGGGRCLWLIPITKSEVDFKKKNGFEALEDRFEKAGFDYLDPMRKAVC